MQSRSWNLAVPYREQRFAHTPSESIANNYTPTASELKLKLLPAKKFKSSNVTSSSYDSARKSNDFQSRFISKKDMISHRPDPSMLYPPSRPMSPMEQIELMEAIERDTEKIIAEPTEMDLERYYFYIDKGTDRSMIAPLSQDQIDKFYRMVPQKLKLLKNTRQSLNGEILEDYVYSMKKSIVDYILMNPEERDRLNIESVPKSFAHK